MQEYVWILYYESIFFCRVQIIEIFKEKTRRILCIICLILRALDCASNRQKLRCSHDGCTKFWRPPLFSQSSSSNFDSTVSIYIDGTLSLRHVVAAFLFRTLILQQKRRQFCVSFLKSSLLYDQSLQRDNFSVLAEDSTKKVGNQKVWTVFKVHTFGDLVDFKHDMFCGLACSCSEITTSPTKGWLIGTLDDKWLLNLQRSDISEIPLPLLVDSNKRTRKFGLCENFWEKYAWNQNSLFGNTSFSNFCALLQNCPIFSIKLVGLSFSKL